MYIKVFNYEDGSKLFQYKSNVVPRVGERIMYNEIGATVATVLHDVRNDEHMPNVNFLECVEIEVNID